MRVLSGIQPSGRLHLGNYFGMMKPMLKMQEKHELFCFIVNYHALTTQFNGDLLRSQTIEAVCDFLALGLDPEKSIFWVQSDLPEVTELTWVLSNITGLGLLERCHSYKDKVTSGIKPNHGLFSYPVLMAADILIMQAERVPVGADQKQHVEVARDIAGKFNNVYGKVFCLPEPEIQHGGVMIPGVDGRKMSKAYKNEIDIFCERKELEQKIKTFKTDSAKVSEAKDLNSNNLYLLCNAFADDKEKEQLKNRFETPGLKYSEVKKELVDKIWTYFLPYRQRREELLRNPEEVFRILRRGRDKAKDAAYPTISNVRKKTGIDYGNVL